MRTIYLIRHGHPDFPLGAHVCLGVTDTPLGPLGRMQACLLGEELSGAGLTAVYTSPLVRCRETAAPLGLDPILMPSLAEQNMGPWDGLDFDTIQAEWPELYRRRGAEPLLVPPGAEALAEVQARVLPAVSSCLEQSRGDIAIVAHASVIQALLAAVYRLPLEESRPLRPSYCAYARLTWDGKLWVEEKAILSHIPLAPEVAEKLLTASGAGERVAAHCRVVAAEALRIARALPLPLDHELLYSAALLHDIARNEKDHARLGAAWLRDLGYEDAAALVEQHHDLESTDLDEAAILFLADKRVQGDHLVSLERRFADSGKKCTTEAARTAHAARLAQALEIQTQINRLCGHVVVP